MARDNIFVDTKELNKLTIELKGFEKEMPGAAVSAINRTLDFMKTQIGRIIPQEYAVKSSEVKASMNKKKASKSNLSAHIVSRGHTLSLAHFPFTPTKAGTGRAVMVKIRKQDGKKEVRTDPKPFVAPTGAKSADKIQNNVFRRTGEKRFPIVVLRTLSVPQMIGNENVESQVQEAAQKKLNERLEHEVKWRLDKIRKKVKS